MRSGPVDRLRVVGKGVFAAEPEEADQAPLHVTRLRDDALRVINTGARWNVDREADTVHA
jgi:hypothetical protein